LNISDSAKDIISKLLNKDPEERKWNCCFELLKKHDFFKGIKWEKFRRRRQSGPLMSPTRCKNDVSNFDDKITKQEVSTGIKKDSNKGKKYPLIRNYTFKREISIPMIIREDFNESYSSLADNAN